MKKYFFLAVVVFFLLQHQLFAQVPSERDLVGKSFELCYKLGDKWVTYAMIKFKKYKVAELSLYASNKRGERVILPGTAIWDMVGDKFTMVGDEARFRSLISENTQLSQIPSPINFQVSSQVTKSGAKDFIITPPYINWGHETDAQFEAKVKNKTAYRNPFMLKGL